MEKGHGIPLCVPLCHYLLYEKVSGRSDSYPLISLPGFYDFVGSSQTMETHTVILIFSQSNPNILAFYVSGSGNWKVKWFAQKVSEFGLGIKILSLLYS